MTGVAVGVIIGSLSAESVNRSLHLALKRLAPAAGLDLTEIPIRPLPMYDRDLDDSLPEAVIAFKARLLAVEGVIIVTPEYNRSIPGTLKNALDWASRPWGENSFRGKPSAVIGASIGSIGTAVAQQHLRSILSYFASPELAQPEAYIHARPGLILPDGRITEDSTEAFLLRWLGAVRNHVVGAAPSGGG